MASSTTALTPEQAQAALRTLLEGPAMSPPAGVVPNFHNPANLDVFVTLTITLCVTFGTLAVLLRMYTKMFIIRALALEDYVIVLAWIGETVPSGIVTRYGGGTHMWNVRLQTFFAMLYWVNISAIVYGFVVFFIKLSILLQYLRIFAPTRKGNLFIYVGVHVCIWSNLVFYLVETVFEIAICTPRQRIWNPLMTTGHCFSVDATFQATGVFNVISDFVILILPMPCVWRLHMPLKKRLLMTTIFATGFFACVTSILRTSYTWTIVRSPDISYNMVPMGLWTYAELSTGIVISCLPVMPKFFQHFGPTIFRALTTPRSSKFTQKEFAAAPVIFRDPPTRSTQGYQATSTRDEVKHGGFVNPVVKTREREVGSLGYEQWPERGYELRKEQSRQGAGGRMVRVPAAAVMPVRTTRDLESGMV